MFDCLCGVLRDKKWNQPSDNSKNPQNLHKLGRNWDKFLSPAEILVNDNDRSALVFLRNTVFGLITIMKKLLEIHFYLKFLIWSWHTARYDKQKIGFCRKVVSNNRLRKWSNILRRGLRLWYCDHVKWFFISRRENFTCQMDQRKLSHLRWACATWRNILRRLQKEYSSRTKNW